MRTEKILNVAAFTMDGETRQVQLPHTWNNLDGQDGGDDYRRGHGVYKMALPNPTKGKRQYIQFEGANHIASCSCNGKPLGEHRGGFSTFRFDLTECMQPENNVLTVDVTNEKCDVYPQNADFTFFGGLYRNVTFLEVENAHFDLMKDGTQGVFVTPHHTGTTRFDLFPVNGEGCQIRVQLLDGTGNQVAEEVCDAESHTVLELSVEHPHLWNGVKDPYLYTAHVSLLKDNQEQDRVTIHYGYRSFRVDPERGFFLNGQSMPLHGVSRHQDRLNKGWAISKADHKEDMAFIREVGANTIRLAHYQHAQYFYDLCDQNGMVIWAEIPFISQFIPGKDARDNTISQMSELVAQNYNHPSICFWGISNEVSIGGESEELFDNLRTLNALVKGMDSSRLTTMAHVSMTDTRSQQMDFTDVLSYNHYMGWYGGDVSENGPWLDAFHQEHPDKALGLSEYGCEAITTWHSADPQNHDYSEEYQAHYHHEMLKTFAKRPYLWSTHLWNMFDFAADARDEGGCKGRNNKGLMTYDRKIKKDSFFIYKAYWTEQPMVHICGSRFTDRAPGERDVTVYSNCPGVSLYVNGRWAGRKKCKDKACVFKNVKLREGENTLVAKADNVQDTVMLRGVAKSNPDYRIPEGAGNAGNWFDAEGNAQVMEFPEGCCSIHDKLGELLDHPEAGPVLMEMITSMAEKMGMGKNVKSMLRMVRSMRLEEILKMMASKLPVGMAYELNKKLIQFKK